MFGIVHYVTYLIGSKDNISAVVVRLSGATLGPVEQGGVSMRRKNRVHENRENISILQK